MIYVFGVVEGGYVEYVSSKDYVFRECDLDIWLLFVYIYVYIMLCV